jgi:hypothetical protein
MNFIRNIILGLVDRFRIGLLEPVPFLKRFIRTDSFSNRFIQTVFYLGNRFKVNKKIKDSKLRLNLKLFLGKLVPKLFL